MVATLAIPMPALAQDCPCDCPCSCGEGLTPGYWKNHTEVWGCGYTPETLVSSVFPNAVAEYSEWDELTLLEALQLGGGPGAKGMAQNLLRHAVAGLLNACPEDDVNYPASVQQVLDCVNGVDWSDRGAMEVEKDKLQSFNELGNS